MQMEATPAQPNGSNEPPLSDNPNPPSPTPSPTSSMKAEGSEVKEENNQVVSDPTPPTPNDSPTAATPATRTPKSVATKPATSGAAAKKPVGKPGVAKTGVSSGTTSATKATSTPSTATSTTTPAQAKSVRPTSARPTATPAKGTSASGSVTARPTSAKPVTAPGTTPAKPATARPTATPARPSTASTPAKPSSNTSTASSSSTSTNNAPRGSTVGPLPVTPAKPTLATPGSRAATSKSKQITLSDKQRAKARSVAASAAAAQLLAASSVDGNDDAGTVESKNGTSSSSSNSSSALLTDSDGTPLDPNDPAFLVALTESLKHLKITPTALNLDVISEGDNNDSGSGSKPHKRGASLHASIDAFLLDSTPTPSSSNGTPTPTSGAGGNRRRSMSKRGSFSSTGSTPKSPSSGGGGGAQKAGGARKFGSRIADAVAQFEKKAAELRAPSLADIALEQRRQLEAYSKKTEQLNQEVANVAKRAETAEHEVGELKQKYTHETSKLEQDLAQCRQLLVEAQQANAAQNQEVQAYKAQIARFQAEILSLQEQLRLGDQIRRHLHNKVLELKGNIRVFCRVRPALPAEVAAGAGTEATFTFPVTTYASLGGMTVAVSTSANKNTTNVGSNANTSHGNLAAPGGAGTDGTSPSSPVPTSPAPSDSSIPTASDSVATAALAAGLTEKTTLIFRGKEEKSVDGIESTYKKHTFAFDRVFSPDETNEDVYAEVGQLVQSALDGFKVCIFAYGQTGSGKTYTMEGTGLDQLVKRSSSGGPLQVPATAGITSRAVHAVFTDINKMAKQGWNHTCRVHILEVYNEHVFTLLPSGAVDGEIQAPEDIARRVQGGWEPEQVELKSSSGGSSSNNNNNNSSVNSVVSGAEPVVVKSAAQVFALLAVASAMRMVRDTAMNERSSRSHCVFQMIIEGKNDRSGESRSGMINLVDLAGSERVKQSKVVGTAFDEAVAINKSLTALGDVIVAIGSGSSHVPYRNSKLTFLLQSCFGGDSKTLMLVNLSPNEYHATESLSSLRFATKVHNCHIGVAQKSVKHG